MSRRGWALFAVMGVIWGLPYLLIKIADGGVSVPVLVFARVATGTLLLLPVALRGGRLRALRPYLKWLVAFAAVEVILPWLLLSTAEQHLSSSLSGLLIAAVPVIGVGVARLAGDRERLSATRWAGLALGLAGVALLGGGVSGRGAAWPVLEVLGTALCYATGPVIADRKLAGADDLAVTDPSGTTASITSAAATSSRSPAVPDGPLGAPPHRDRRAAPGARDRPGRAQAGHRHHHPGRAVNLPRPGRDGRDARRPHLRRHPRRPGIRPGSRPGRRPPTQADGPAGRGGPRHV